MRLASDDTVAVTLIQAIHVGDTASVQRLLAENPGLASARPDDGTGGFPHPVAHRR